MAGHHHMFLIRENKIIKLGTKGFCLMMFPDQLNAENEDIFLNSGDRLFLFSDGMFEVPNEKEEYLGDQKFAEIIETRIHLPSKEFLESIQDEVLVYSGGKVADDMTMLLLEIK